MLVNEVYSQTAVHQPYGGVVPELASRDHIRKALPLVQSVIGHYGIPDIVGYTRGPGLQGALMVGAALAVSLSYAWGKPNIGIHHIEAHMLAVFLEAKHPTFPFLALIVSGGHTLLLYVQGIGQYTLLGTTLDDAVGEAFDKTAKLLGLPYPGGPALSILAEQGDSSSFNFPRPMTQSGKKNLDFSFSGLKTAVVKAAEEAGIIEKKPLFINAKVKADIAAAFQEAAVETLLWKVQSALAQYPVKSVVVAGGVSANQRLREVFSAQLSSEVFFPRQAFCTDNAAMVAYTAAVHAAQGKAQKQWSIAVKPRWPIELLEY